MRSCLLGLATVLFFSACSKQPGDMVPQPACEQQRGAVARWAIPADLELNLRVHVGPRNAPALEAHIAQMYDINHPSYGKFLTPDEYASMYGPTDEQMSRVRAHLVAHGMLVGEQPEGDTWHVKAQVQQAEHAFKTTLHGTEDKFGKRQHTAVMHPKMPEGMPDVVVEGLHSKKDKLSHLKRPGAGNKITHWGATPLDAATIRSAYNAPAWATGLGQTIAMIELDGYLDSDLDVYAQSNHIRRVPTKNILVGGADGSIQDSDAQVEVTMDIQLANAMAPGLDEIVVYEALNGAHGLTDIFSRLANPKPGEKLIKVASLSWGGPEAEMDPSDVEAEYVILRKMAAQGQTVFVASGDDGAHDDGSHLGTDDPASQPFAVAVGGTTLKTKNGAWASETTWSGSGGGISCFWKMPPWQLGLESAAGKGSFTMRDVPDVALNANPSTGYKVFVGEWQTVGGTSCAAPLWAAFAGLVGEARHSVGKSDLGFMAPHIYAVAKSPQGAAGFHDIVSGNNGYYPGVAGLDEATGWGSYNVTELLPLLVAR